MNIIIEQCPYHLHPKEIGRMNELMRQLSSGFKILMPYAHHSAMQRGFVFIARDQDVAESFQNGQNLGRIVGTASIFFLPKLTGLTGYIEDVVVESTYRRQGIGEKMLDVLIALAKERYATSLCLTSAPSRSAAIKMYEKIGFRIKPTNAYHFPLHA